jgi:hypothetical protein
MLPGRQGIAFGRLLFINTLKNQVSASLFGIKNQAKTVGSCQRATKHLPENNSRFRATETGFS